MTVSEQINQLQKRDRWKRWGVVAMVFLALITPLVAVIAVVSLARAEGVANQLDRELSNATVGICNSRITTLRTAPQTVKEHRAVRDAQSEAARKVCPGLDYDGLAKLRRIETAQIEAGTDPATLASLEYRP